MSNIQRSNEESRSHSALTASEEMQLKGIWSNPSGTFHLSPRKAVATLIEWG
jgi:hypothetical protein